MSDDWTFEMPTEEGFYWYRNKNQIGPVLLAKRPDGKLTVTELGVADYSLLEDGPAQEWIGPVDPESYPWPDDPHGAARTNGTPEAFESVREQSYRRGAQQAIGMLAYTLKDWGLEPTAEILEDFDAILHDMRYHDDAWRSRYMHVALEHLRQIHKTDVSEHL